MSWQAGHLWPNVPAAGNHVSRLCSYQELLFGFHLLELQGLRRDCIARDDGGGPLKGLRRKSHILLAHSRQQTNSIPFSLHGDSAGVELDPVLSQESESVETSGLGAMGGRCQGVRELGMPGASGC